MVEPRGDFIGGTFHAPTGEGFRSYDPTKDEEVVLETAGSVDRVGEACAAAADAQAAWAARSRAERVALLHDFRDAIAADGAALAEAIRLEMGKVQSEADTEVRALIGRFALVEKQLDDVTDRPGQGEALRYRPHGVVGVLGPFNFPLHLCNAHVLPALALGNTVVMKPSEVTPLAGERYAACAKAAGLPPGVFNVVQGGGAVGAAVASDPRVRALAFTGSWPTGRRILEASLDRPEMLLALEMGGKNMCVVLDDADLRQAAHEIITSGYLTTGQRCTGSDRVLVHASVADRLIAAVKEIVEHLQLGDPNDPKSFAGPLANRASKERYLAMLEVGEAGGAEPILRGDADRPGAFVGPSLHRLGQGAAEIEGYTDHELFGPDLCVQLVEDDDEAIAILERSEYGFANSVFTRDPARFARFEREVSTGILNRNRSTNRASPRLPFGGVKKSGNFRPAGAWASRNLVYAQAQLLNEPGVFDRHPLIVEHLVAPDLDALERHHGVEECQEVGRTLLDHPRPERTCLPEGGAMASSERWLERFHAGDRFVVGEKKPVVFDHLRSRGPWMVSVDDEPLSVIDAMSQTATLPAGFAPDAAVRAYVEGDFGDALMMNRDTTLGGDPAVEAYAETLRGLVPGLATVSFANSGAEANELAYALCMREAKRDSQKKLLAFEGSFHGRTMLALYASHNPAKRAPFEIAGYEVDFLGAPLIGRGTHATGSEGEPDGWREVWGAADLDEAKARWGDETDLTLRAEAAALLAVGETLKAGEHFAVVIEPMQSEGGDRYVSPRFHRGLRLLTRALETSLIVDEVQCGYGLGGPFLWHQAFGYVDASGADDGPDCVCFAKRAQVGVVMSRYEDPEPTATFVPSLIRGRIHAELVGDGDDARRVEGLVQPQLEELARRWSHRIENPRAEGYALAFDLASPAELGAYLGQRFFRGVVVFGAGTRTVRYRLNASFDARTIALLFNSIQRSLAWLEAHPGKKPPAWEDFDETQRATREDPAIAIREAKASEADALLPKIMEIEARTYEPARRDSREHLAKGFSEHGVAVVAEKDSEVVGSALGAPLELFDDVEGVDADPMLGRDNTMYCIAVTVDPDHHGAGIGRRLKTALLRAARGRGRFAHASGRNRVPEAASMTRLNDSLGAYTVARLDDQYGEGAVARYYRQPLGAFVPADAESKPESKRSASAEATDLASGIARPFAEPPQSLAALHRSGALYGPAVTKVTVLNYVTPAVVRATEWIGAVVDSHPHLYLCSSRDETTDKAIRAMRYHRQDGDTVIGFEGGYVGHTTACARSISDPSVHGRGAPYFDWPRVPHPADGIEASIARIRTIIAERGADRVLGLMIEPVQERTGKVVPAEFYAELEAVRIETGVPVAFAETASSYYRSGHGPFASSGLDFAPDLIAWWTGGHLGLLHTNGAYRVDKPFVLVSTWDGDELSLIQAHHQLRAARHVDVAAGSAALEGALEGVHAHGLGLYRVIDAGDGADALAKKLEAAGVRARRYPGGRLAIAARLDRAVEDAEALGAALRG